MPVKLRGIGHAENEFEKFEVKRRHIEANNPTGDFDKLAKQITTKKTDKAKKK